MPELPEVESLAAFLRGHATGHAVARADAASFSVLKTFDPPLTDLSGQVITEVGRHGKFLDLVTDQGLHLIMHLARAGWLRWRDDLPTAPPPGADPHQLLEIMGRDKKALAGLTFVLDGPRGVEVVAGVPRDDVAKVLKDFVP